MAAQRPRANESRSGPHSISLKVLRLSRPTLATQTPLPATDFGNGLDINTTASLAYPTGNEYSSFPLTPALTLPSSFGLAYVGERFACTLCANNELDASSNKSVSRLKITVDLQTPSSPNGTSLELISTASERDGFFELDCGRTLQCNIQHDLKEAGSHVLAVTITYTETFKSDADAEEDVIRTFRKLYQFVSQQLISVRSKITERKVVPMDDVRRWIIEAQLENVGENSVILEQVSLKEQEGIRLEDDETDEIADAISLKPQDIQQVMFLVAEVGKVEGKRQLGQITVRWNGSMGEPGKLTTGWLTSKT